MRESGNFTLVSLGPDGGNGAFSAFQEIGGWVSHDGHRAYFRTFEPLVSSDTDTAIDTYSWHDGVVEHVSQGPTGGNTGTEGRFMGASQPDGARAFLQTPESLVAGDTDARSDVYERASGATTLLSTGPAGGNGAFDVDLPSNAWTEDGGRVFFHTNEKLVAADTDTAYDLYERSGGSVSLVSPGAGGQSQLAAITSDASRIFFQTNEQLVGADTDGLTDLYERAGSAVTLVTPTPQANPGHAFSVSCCYARTVSQDGTRLFFYSTESYAASDTDTQRDIYVASVSPGPPAPGYPRPAGASPLRVPLVPAYQPCSAPNREHGPPLAFASCNPPAQASANLTIGTPDANGRGASSTGRVQFGVMSGDPATGADEADVAMSFILTDVRVRSTLADYTGQLRSTATVQITDRSNGTGADAATVQALDFPVTVPCVATAGTAGATCQVTTSFDAVLPGVVTEGRRSIWEFERVRVNDGGPDGQAGTAPNDLFATQGIFVP